MIYTFSWKVVEASLSPSNMAILSLLQIKDDFEGVHGKKEGNQNPGLTLYQD